MKFGTQKLPWTKTSNLKFLTIPTLQTLPASKKLGQETMRSKRNKFSSQGCQSHMNELIESSPMGMKNYSLQQMNVDNLDRNWQYRSE